MIVTRTNCVIAMFDYSAIVFEVLHRPRTSNRCCRDVAAGGAVVQWHSGNGPGERKCFVVRDNNLILFIN